MGMAVDMSSVTSIQRESERAGGITPRPLRLRARGALAPVPDDLGISPNALS